MFPKIHLAVDNCFASKRWTEPHEWMQIVKDAGANFVEASADNECDPLYTPPDVMRSWLDNVQDAARRFSIQVCNLYSGHGTYATLGLAHPDQRVRDHIQHNWLEPMIHHAGTLGAGLGFFCHAFSQQILADPQRYRLAVADLVARFAELARYAGDYGMPYLAVEQMYSPHQIPWTIDGAKILLSDVHRQGSTAFYITLDTGHQVGQKHHLRPSLNDVERYVHAMCDGKQATQTWIGFHKPVPDTDADVAVAEAAAYVQQHPYLFSDPKDGDLYVWLETLGCYSPIIHLQQTDGVVSAHRPFTVKYNRDGIVSPANVLKALYRAYQENEIANLPPCCRDIFLTLEIFSGTAEHPADILSDLRESVAYWRDFIPQDGLTLDQLIK